MTNRAGRLRTFLHFYTEVVKVLFSPLPQQKDDRGVGERQEERSGETK